MLGEHRCVLKGQNLSVTIEGLASSVTLLRIFLTWWDPADLLQATTWHPGKTGQLGNQGSNTYSLPGCPGSTDAWCIHGSAIGSVGWKEQGLTTSPYAFQGFLVPRTVWQWLERILWISFIWEEPSLCAPRQLHNAHQSGVSGNDQQICFKSMLVIWTKTVTQMHPLWTRLNQTAALPSSPDTLMQYKKRGRFSLRWIFSYPQTPKSLF